jgi:hypothetical protein
MVMIVLDRVLLVSASSRQREGKRYGKSIFISQCRSNVVELYLYLGVKATIEP